MGNWLNEDLINTRLTDMHMQTVLTYGSKRFVHS